jgi:hypothetical protein
MPLYAGSGQGHQNPGRDWSQLNHTGTAIASVAVLKAQTGQGFPRHHAAIPSEPRSANQRRMLLADQ